MGGVLTGGVRADRRVRSSVPPQLVTKGDVAGKEGAKVPKSSAFEKRWRGVSLDFVNLITAMPGRQSSD